MNGNGATNWTRVMDFAARLAVPVILGVGTVVITHEVALSEVRLRVGHLEEAISKLPPEWLEKQVELMQQQQREIIRNQQNMLARLAVLEDKD